MEQLGIWGEFLLKLTILLAGVYVIILLTPKLASYIDKRRKNSGEPKAPRPERVQDEIDNDNSGEDSNGQPNSK